MNPILSRLNLISMKHSSSRSLTHVHTSPSAPKDDNRETLAVEVEDSLRGLVCRVWISDLVKWYRL